MPNRTEARPAKAVLTYATGRLPLLRLFSTPLKSRAVSILLVVLGISGHSYLRGIEEEMLLGICTYPQLSRASGICQPR